MFEEPNITTRPSLSILAVHLLTSHSLSSLHQQVTSLSFHKHIHIHPHPLKSKNLPFLLLLHQIAQLRPPIMLISTRTQLNLLIRVFNLLQQNRSELPSCVMLHPRFYFFLTIFLFCFFFVFPIVKIQSFGLFFFVFITILLLPFFFFSFFDNFFNLYSPLYDNFIQKKQYIMTRVGIFFYTLLILLFFFCNIFISFFLFRYFYSDN